MYLLLHIFHSWLSPMVKSNCVDNYQISSSSLLKYTAGLEFYKLIFNLFLNIIKLSLYKINETTKLMVKRSSGLFCSSTYFSSGILNIHWYFSSGFHSISVPNLLYYSSLFVLDKHHSWKAKIKISCNNQTLNVHTS